MKKALILILFLTMLITLTIGCGEDERTAKQIVLDSLVKNLDIKSMTYSGKLDVVMDSNINKFTITFTGKKINEPLQMETDINSTTNIQGMNLTLDIPIIAKDDFIYFKIPSILQPFMSKSDKEYLVTDISFKNIADYKVDTANLYKILIDDFDDSSFVKEEKNSYSAEGVNIGNVVAINITKENLKTFLENFTDDGLTELINYLDKYSIAEKQKFQLQQYKFELDSNSKSVDKIVNDFNQKLTINKINIVGIYDKNEILRKIILDLDVKVNDNQQNETNIAIKGEYIIETINKNVKFEMHIPSIEQTEKIE